MRQLTTAVIVFLAATVIVLSTLTVYLTYRCRENAIRAIEAKREAVEIEQDRREILADNISLYRDIDAMQKRIDVLTAANKALLNRKEPEITAVQTEPEQSETVKKEEILQANAKERLPEGRTNVISGMPYTTITDKKSEQWALQLQAYTGKYGIRCYFDGDRIYFLVAMGSVYGRTIGDAFRVTLKCGTVMYVMLGEFKDDGKDPNFFGHPTTHADGYDVTCVLEFIYDAEHINSKALQAGNFCNIECFGGLHGYGGDIIKIEYLGRKWKP